MFGCVVVMLRYIFLWLWFCVCVAVLWLCDGHMVSPSQTASDFCVSPDTYITRVTKENAVINQGRGTREGQSWMEGVGEMCEQKEGRGEAGKRRD